MTPEAFIEARKSLGLNQTQLAREIRIYGGTISRWERGEQVIPDWAPVALMGVAAMEVARAALRSAPAGEDDAIAISPRLIESLAVLGNVARVAGITSPEPVNAATA